MEFDFSPYQNVTMPPEAMQFVADYRREQKAVSGTEPSVKQAMIALMLAGGRKIKNSKKAQS